MEHQLQLTSRGYAVCELMRTHGLSLEAACERLEDELASLRQTVERIMDESTWEDVPLAMQTAFADVSIFLQGAYLEEQQHPSMGDDGAALSA